MTKWAMDAFYSAHFCVEVNLRHKLSHLFSEICQHKELMRGPQSCTHSCSGAAGRSQTSDRVTGQLCGLVRTLFLRCEERRGEEGVFPLISPLSRWQSVLESTVHACYMCVVGSVRMADSGIPVIFVNHFRSCRRKVTDPSGASQRLPRWWEMQLQ